ncbi:MAG: molybdopterin-dependent oxidoreductase [Candidatus Abyssubacteria bacterium]
MKVGRRQFIRALTFAAGGALGFMTSPAPWHLVRDLARWTQNWPWVPVPPHGKPAYLNSICGMCNGGCGITVRKVGERLVGIEGNRRHPVNRGLMCPHGTAGLQMVYGPARVKEPLRRTGTRREPAWEPVTWEQAISEVVGKIQALRSEANSHALACITNSCDSTVNLLFERFLQAVGSRNFMKMNSGRDARELVARLMQGTGGDMGYDFERTKLVLSFGCSLLEGWGSCTRMLGAYREWADEAGESKTQIIQIEPNLSVTATKASEWVPIKPGSEGALALGLAHVLIRDELYDREFVREYCFGFEDWADKDGKRRKGFKSLVLAGYSPLAVEKMTGVEAHRIEKLARAFATKKPSLAVAGGGTGELFNDLYELMAVHSLNALVGNINQPGGVFIKPEPPLSPLPAVIMDEEAERGFAVGRADEAGGEAYPFSRYLPCNVNPEKVKVLLIHEANPYYALPDRETRDRIFERIPYIVSFSSYMDESAAMADLVLPIPTRYERWDDQVASPESPLPIYNLTRPLIEPEYQTKPAGDILMEMAGRLGGSIAESFPWEDMQELLKARARGLYESGRGVIDTSEALVTADRRVVAAAYGSFVAMWEKLVENSCWFDPNPQYADLSQAMKTPSGRFEFYSQRLKEALGFQEDVDCMPHYIGPPAHPEGFDLLVMPEVMLVTAGNGKPTPPFVMKQIDDDVLKHDKLYVQINPITAMYRNLKDGDDVIVETPRGKVKTGLRVFEGVREGVVLIPLGLGHTAYDEFLQGKGVNAHDILEARKDKVSGLPVWWSTPGKITKA